ncbi:unnamed protein product, partial [Didymodactylos carnosus]
SRQLLGLPSRPRDPDQSQPPSTNPVSSNCSSFDSLGSLSDRLNALHLETTRHLTSISEQVAQTNIMIQCTQIKVDELSQVVSNIVVPTINQLSSILLKVVTGQGQISNAEVSVIQNIPSQLNESVLRAQTCISKISEVASRVLSDHVLLSTVLEELNSKSTISSLISNWKTTNQSPPPNPKPFTAIHYNVQGLSSRLSEVQYLIDLKQPTVVVCTEIGNTLPKSLSTWFPSHRKYATTDRNAHGGVLILVHTSVTSKQVHSHTDILTVSVSLGCCSLTVIGVYSPRSSRLPIGELRTQFTAAAKMTPRSPVLLMGDLNACSISWGCKASDSRGNKFEALCEEFDLAVENPMDPRPKGQTTLLI